ncbi:MAG TPA: phosphoribosylanthranilate isomerase [Desulfomonilaceae bacterium]|nr:phosphoribosylanthranilate isomerase [Desulfomonilaceae bacterium]
MAVDNNTVRVKMCGITRGEDAHAAVGAGVHALGFVFHPPSPRYITPERAASIIISLPPFIPAVGVFVNRGKEEIEAVVTRAGLEFIQLQGDEKPEDCAGYSRPVIKAFRFTSGMSFPNLAAYPVAGFLMEGQVSGLWGGTGVPMDWGLLNKHLETVGPAVRSRLVLAGGLDPQNVAMAVRVVKPFAVDVCTGVEKEPGIKDHEKIKEFMNAL